MELGQGLGDDPLHADGEITRVSTESKGDLAQRDRGRVVGPVDRVPETHNAFAALDGPPYPCDGIGRVPTASRVSSARRWRLRPGDRRPGNCQSVVHVLEH